MARITTTEELTRGDVVRVAVQLTDKTTGAPYWWHTFRVVIEVINRNFVSLLTLKLTPDPFRDFREVDVRKDVVEKIEPDNWPQGVAAMYMKHAATGVIKVGDDS